MWKIFYHPDVESDLRGLGHASARRILKVIENKLGKEKPELIGKPLRKTLSGYRRLRVGDTRIIYRPFHDKIEILILAVGPRRNDEIYDRAEKRVD